MHGNVTHTYTYKSNIASSRIERKLLSAVCLENVIFPETSHASHEPSRVTVTHRHLIRKKALHTVGRYTSHVCMTSIDFFKCFHWVDRKMSPCLRSICSLWNGSISSHHWIKSILYFPVLRSIFSLNQGVRSLKDLSTLVLIDEEHNMFTISTFTETKQKLYVLEMQLGYCPDDFLELFLRHVRVRGTFPMYC